MDCRVIKHIKENVFRKYWNITTQWLHKFFLFEYMNVYMSVYMLEYTHIYTDNLIIQIHMIEYTLKGIIFKMSFFSVKNESKIFLSYYSHDRLISFLLSKDFLLLLQMFKGLKARLFGIIPNYIEVFGEKGFLPWSHDCIDTL